MRRAHLEEPALEALRIRCLDLGERIVVETDREGECTLRVGALPFGDFDDAVAHVIAALSQCQRAGGTPAH